MFLSIHHNFYRDKKVSGFELFAYKSKGKAAQIAELMAIEVIQVVLRGKDRKLRLESAKRLFKTANFHVVKNTTMPSILVEWGFMSNDDEFDKMAELEGSQYSQVSQVTYLLNCIKNIIDLELI